MIIPRFSKIGIFIFLIFILTVGAVSADDSNQTGDVKSFDELNGVISNADSVIDIDCDYTFNPQSDEKHVNGIEINHKKVIINGNNHVIDADSRSRIFSINASDITINNLIFKNANSSAIFIENSTLKTNNVTFIGNVNNNGGALYGKNTTFTSVSDKFIDNEGKFGSAILLKGNSTFNLISASFENQKEMDWGLIDLTSSKFMIANTTFRDMKSKYSTALNMENSEGLIENCTFLNLYACMTAGAIGYIELENSLIISNCNFINSSSFKNAGAILLIGAQSALSTNSSPDSINGKFIIKNSSFTDCHSQFGGAVMQLDSILDMSNCSFENNSADYAGAGIYLSGVNAALDNVNFNRNVVVSSNENYNMGGAIFFDMGNLTADNLDFTDNSAVKGSAVYLYDSNYSISNSNFRSNNKNYVYSVFDGKTASLDDSNTFIDEANSINQTDYTYVCEGWGSQIDYNPVILDENLAGESYFNLADYGLVTSVKNQGQSGSCWAFGTAAALESAILKATNRSMDLDISENNIKGLGLKYYFYGINMDEGASPSTGASYLLSWLGYVNEEDDSFDELGRISRVMYDANRHHIFDCVKLPKYTQSVKDLYKQALVKYGAFAVAVHGADGGISGDYNEKTYGAYFVDNGEFIMADHVVTLVGWNDTYSRYNFNQEAPGDGAWIIKNSWGPGWGDDGYYYVSYFDERFGAVDGGTLTFIINNEHNYEKVYQYDMLSSEEYKFGTNKGNLTAEEVLQLMEENFEEYMKYDKSLRRANVTFANTYKSVGDDFISAVGTYFNDSDVDYSFSVAVNGKTVYVQSGKSSWKGYETIKLNSYVPIKEGDLFTINFTSNKVPVSQSRQKVPPGMTGSDMEYGIWSDLTLGGYVACIKAYTVPQSNLTIKADDVTVDYGNDVRIIVSLLSDDVPVSGATVKVTFNEMTYYAVSDGYGNAVIIVPAYMAPGVCAAEASFESVSAAFKITVIKKAPEMPDDEESLKEDVCIEKSNDSGICLSDHSSGNPICALLMILMALGCVRLNILK